MPTCQPPASGQVEGMGRQCTGLWSTCLRCPPPKQTRSSLSIYPIGPCACLVTIHSFIHSFYTLSPCQAHY